MGYRALFCVVASAATLLILSCSDDPTTFKATVTVVEYGTSYYDPEMEPPPLEGVQVCEADTSNCVTTDSDGIAELTLPRSINGALTMEKDGYLSVIVPFNRTSDVSATTPIGSDELVAGFAAVLGVPYPLTDEGVLTITVSEPEEEGEDTVGVAGVTYELVEGTGGDVFYVDENGIPTATQTSTATPPGWGGFTEAVPEGAVVRYDGAPDGCTPSLGWPGAAANTVEMPVRAGFQTQAQIFCP